MKYDQEYIYTLLLRKQLGTLSQVEDKLLQKLMETDEQVRNCWIEQEEARRYTFNAFLEDLRVEHDWCEVREVLTPKPLHTRIYYFLKKYRAVALILFAVILAATVFICTCQHKKPHVTTHFATYQKEITPVEEAAAMPDIAIPVMQLVCRHIESDNKVITTSLVQGSLITDVGDNLDVTLTPGYEAIYRPGEPFKVKRFNQTITFGWRDGMYCFTNKPLEDIGPAMMRWFGLKLDFLTPALSHRLFSADLDKDKPLSAFLDEICSDSDIDYKVYDETIYFSVRKSGN